MEIITEGASLVNTFLKITGARSAPAYFGRGRRLRTLGLRFWRPPLYQLSYSPILNWWTVRDSNPGPTGYEPVALPTELTVLIVAAATNVAAVSGASCRTRTYDPAVNSRMLYLLS